MYLFTYTEIKQLKVFVFVFKNVVIRVICELVFVVQRAKKKCKNTKYYFYNFY